MEHPSIGGLASTPPSPNGMGWITFASGDTQESSALPDFRGGQNLPTAVDVRRMEIGGTLNADQTTMTFDIPVGPMTESLGLSLRELASDGGMTPAFGQFELLDPSGVPIEQSNPPPGPGPGALQALNVLLRNATSGSRLEVQIVPGESLSGTPGMSSSSESGTGLAAPSVGSSFNVSFVLNVQRQDYVVPTDESGATMPSSSSVGTLVVAPALQSGVSVASSSWVAGDPAATTPVDEQAATTTAFATAGARSSDIVEPMSEAYDGFDARLLTGPLASRTASPLGPTLASIDAEATQQVDRHERALSQLIEGVEPLDGKPSVAWRSREPDDGSAGLESDQPGSFGAGDGPVVDAPGNRGYPMKVTAPR